MKRFVVIAYDIKNNRKRTQIASILEKHGKRVNKSVFECFVSDTRLQELQNTIAPLVHKTHDTVLYYTLCKECIGKREHQGWYYPAPSSVILL